MLELVLVRHGETDSNIRGTYCGWTDSNLNLKGKNQARRAARKLKDIRPDFIYSSPLKRAFCTAEIINRNYGKEIICLDTLKEHNFGVWEDMTHAEILEKYPDESSEWQKDWINYRIEGGESAMEGYRRVVAFLEELINKHKNCTILIVTHSGCIRYILAHLLEMPIEGIWRFAVENGGIARIVVNDERFAYLKGLNI